MMIRTFLLLFPVACCLFSLPIARTAQAQAPANAADPARTTWIKKIMLRLRQARERPPSPAAGTAIVLFTMDRSGRVLTAEIAKSSGNEMLDAYATSLVRRASPFPPPPASFTADIVRLGLPVNFVGEPMGAHAIQ